jgi:hypothetical protein
MQRLKSEGVVLPPGEEQVAHAWLLRCALQPEETRGALLTQLEQTDTGAAQGSPWWRGLRDSSDYDASIVMALLTHSRAVSQLVTQQEQARLKAEQEERQKQLSVEAAHQQLQHATVNRWTTAVDKNIGTAQMAIFLWFLFYIGSVVSIYCLVQCIKCRNECRSVGMSPPSRNAKAIFWSLAPLIAFPVTALIILATVHGA